MISDSILRFPVPESVARDLDDSPRLERDVECPGCGYNLRGLRVSGACPECGLPVRLPKSVHAPLAEVPAEIVVRIRNALWIGCGGAMVAILLAVVGAADAPRAWAWIAGAMVAWCVATWLMTPGVHNAHAAVWGVGRRSRLRMAARLAQAPWLTLGVVVLVAAQAAAAVAPAALPGWFGPAFKTLALLGYGGVVVLALYLQRVARWACDDFAESALNVTVFGVPAAWLVGFLPLGVLTILESGLWLFSALAFPVGLLSLAHTVGLCVHHSREGEARDGRRQERREQYVRESRDAVRAMNDAAARREARERLLRSSRPPGAARPGGAV